MMPTTSTTDRQTDWLTDLLTDWLTDCHCSYRVCGKSQDTCSVNVGGFEVIKQNGANPSALLSQCVWDVRACKIMFWITRSDLRRTNGMSPFPKPLLAASDLTNMMHFSFNLLRIKGLYMFRALLAHPQEATHKRHFVYCVRMSVVCGTVATVPQTTDIRTQYTKCRLCSVSWGCLSNDRNMQRPLILNKLNESAWCCFHYTYDLVVFYELWTPSLSFPWWVMEFKMWWMASKVCQQQRAAAL
jgi:hypothetical protein